MVKHKEDEKKLMTEYESDSAMRQFIERNAVAALRFEEWGAALVRLQEVENGSRDGVQGYAQQKAKKEDLPILRKLGALQERLAALQGGSSSKEIARVFKKVFVKMSSRTREVTKKQEKARYAFTIGNDGFGRRYNVQSDGIRRYEEIVALLACRAEVVASLKEMRGMSAWIAKFERFADIVRVPEMFGGDEGVVISLPRSVLLPSDVHYRSEQGVVSSSEVEFSSRDHLRLAYTVPFSGSVHVVDFDGDVHCGFSYMQLREHLPMILAEVEKRLVPDLERGEKVIEELQEAFKAELTMNSL
jgi:hypothetical protein